MEKAILANPEAATLYPNYLPNQIRLEMLKPSIGKQQESDIARTEEKAKTTASTWSISLPDELFQPIKPLKQVKEFVITSYSIHYTKLYDSCSAPRTWS